MWDTDREGEDACQRLLQRITERTDVGYLFLLCQDDLVWFSKRRDELRSGVTLVASAHDVMATCVDKGTMQSVAAQSGVPGPRWSEVRDYG